MLFNMNITKAIIYCNLNIFKHSNYKLEQNTGSLKDIDVLWFDGDPISFLPTNNYLAGGTQSFASLITDFGFIVL